MKVSSWRTHFACRVHTRVNAWNSQKKVFARVRTRHAKCVRHEDFYGALPALVWSEISSRFLAVAVLLEQRQRIHVNQQPSRPPLLLLRELLQFPQRFIEALAIHCLQQELVTKFAF
jgi:hypothetical protein